MDPPPIELETSPDMWFLRAAAGVTTRGGGVSDGPFRSLNLGRSVGDDPALVTENERRVLARLELADRVARLRLEHGRSILVTSATGLLGPADALLTGDPDLTLWLTVADCVPLAVQCGARRALAHCGWRGVALGLPGRVVHALREDAQEASPPMRAWIGPGIKACCYQVGVEVAERFSPSAVRREPGAIRLDLSLAIREQLEESGLDPTDIAVSRSCTACDPDRFFSHRRDGFPAGRMAALFWPVEPTDQPGTPPSTSL